MTSKKLIIIDGNALIHRSFHALPPSLTTKDNVMVNAVYGFSSFLLKALNDLSPDYIALTLDEKGPTFRHKEYKEYKAKRVKAPDELYAQIPLVKRVAKAFDMPVYSQSGFEADDLIGSIVKQLETEKNLEKIIITGDLDTLQLIDAHTQVYTMSRGLSDSVIYDKSQVESRYGLQPNQIIDYKALRGDPSDNIPGVPGVGEKTATDLLQLFGTLENLYEHIDKYPETEDIKPKILKSLQINKDLAFLSKRLATIKKDIDINFKLEDCRLKSFNIEDVKKIFLEFEFSSLVNRLEKIKSLANENNNPKVEVDKFARNQKLCDYKLVETEKDFKNFLSVLEKQSEFAFDTEASSLEVFEASLLGISFSWSPKKAYYLNLNLNQNKNSLFTSSKDNWLNQLKPIFSDSNIKKYGHNAKFDIRLLRAYGVEVENFAFDTKIAAYLINPGDRQHSLDALSLHELNWEKINSDDLLGTGRNKIDYKDVKPEKMSLYSCEDADCTYQLVAHLEKELKKDALEDLYYQLELPMVKVLAHMEDNGIYIDKEKLKKLETEISKKLLQISQEIYKDCPYEFNLSSPKQLQKVIFEELDIPTDNIKRTKTGYSTAFEELEKLKDKHPIISLIQEYRELNKLQNTYIEALPKLIDKKTNKLHTSFTQTVTATGRLSSVSPNLQNIPVRHEIGKKIRSAFTSKPTEKILALDYSQIELRVAAHLSKDKVMIKNFLDSQDIHASTAASIYQIKESEVSAEMRRQAKSINFGILYGQGPHGLSQNADISFAEAKEFIAKYFQTYQGIKKYIENTIKEARENNYVKTILGRRRYLPEINSQVSLIKKSAERMAVNTPIQGSAADIIKMAMLEIYNKYKDKEDIKLLLQVHDELIFSVKEDKLNSYAKEIKAIMENIYKLKVPLIADIKAGNSWGELE
ncbi:MAG: DNA polymerase I [Candidatus Pacebacteria bacterium]|nr:DNA polymerase I [Candidatus Paceibacterota bacterium]